MVLLVRGVAVVTSSQPSAAAVILPAWVASVAVDPLRSVESLAVVDLAELAPLAVPTDSSLADAQRAPAASAAAASGGVGPASLAAPSSSSALIRRPCVAAMAGGPPPRRRPSLRQGPQPEAVVLP